MLLRDFQTDESGGVLVLGAFTLPVLAGFFGLGLEVGAWQTSRAELQAAVDTVARKGALEIEMTKDPEKARLAAIATALANDLDMSRTSVTFGAQGDHDSVIVKTSRTLPRYFSLLYSDGKDIKVDAAAEAYAVPDRVGACILALAPDGIGVQAAGTSDIDATGCSIHSNALRADSFDPIGSAHVIADCITTSQTSDASAMQYTLNTCEAIEDNVPAISDPYVNIPIPDAGNPEAAIVGPYFDARGVTGGTHKTSQKGSTLGSSIHEHLLIDSDATLENGATLVIVDGTLEFKGNNTATGENVTFILINSTIKTGSQFNMQLSAKTSGTYGGLLFAGRREGLKQYHSLRGGATTALTGAVYLPSDQLEMVGGSQVTGGCFHAIAAEIKLAGNSSFGNVCGGVGTRAVGEDAAGGVRFAGQE